MQKIKDFFLELKVLRNCAYIKNNRKKVLSKIQKEVQKRKLKVAFLCSSMQKWKCQSIFELMQTTDIFEPFVFLTSKQVPDGAICELDYETFLKNIEFFKSKDMPYEIGYDYRINKFIPIEKFKPDIIFYTDPWYCPDVQNPIVTSKFALSYYVPYFIANVANEMEYGLRFHRYIQKHYVLNDKIKEFYSSKMKNKGENLCAIGHPCLDYFYLNKDKNFEKKYVIYSPHWSINYERENYATFEWNGKWILEYAQKHPEINWVYRPHPTLKTRLLSEKIMSKEEIENYWNSWAEIGLNYDGADYLDLFMQSNAIISDCGSFITEYLLTKNPYIHLVSKKAYGYNPNAKEIIKNYYCAENLSELEKLLDEVVIKKQDKMRNQRLEYLEKTGFLNKYVACEIIEDIKKDLKID